MPERKSFIIILLSIFIVCFGVLPVLAGKDAGSDHSYDTRRRPIPCQPWRLMVRLAPAITLPGDAEHTFVTAGVGFDGDIILPLQDRLTLRLSFGRSGLRVDDEKVTNAYEPAVLPPLEFMRIYHMKFEVTAYRYYISACYFWFPEYRRRGAMMYSIYGGVGVVTHLIDYEIYTAYDLTGEVFITDVDTSLSFPAMTLGGEVTMFISSRVGINFGLGTDIVLVFQENCLDCRRWSDRVTTYDATFDFRLGMIVVF